MRTLLRTTLLLSGLCSFLSNFTYSQTDSTLHFQVEGRIIDSRTSDPVVSASIFIKGSSVGTVANMDGEFVLKVPRVFISDSLVISSIGYENLNVGISYFSEKNQLVRLKAVPIPLGEVTIVNKDARYILTAAIEKIRDNYSVQPSMVTSFYRENIRKGRKYVSVSEAVLEGYKASYASIFDMDRVSILKARKSSDYKDQDTLFMKLQGGPLTMFRLDFVKNPGELLDRNAMPYYQYNLSGQTIIDNRRVYVISFRQLPEIEIPFYKGKFFVGVEDFAFMGAQFHLDEEHIDRASEFMVKSEPTGVKIDVDKADYLVTYRFFSGKWHLSYVRSELVITVNWKKKLFNSTFTSKIEMAVTGVDSTDITRFKRQDIVKDSDIFVEQVTDFEDPGFWGDYNIIRPEESIQSAIERMGRQIKTE